MCSPEPQIELIEFLNPRTPGCRLYIPKLSWPSDKKEDLSDLLHAKFSKFGILHNIHIDRGEPDLEDEKSTNIWYAYVSFYSTVAAKKAKVYLHQNLIINGKVCKVQVAKERAATDLPLAVHKCVELANHYFGFNGWSSEVIYKNLETEETVEKISSQMFAIGMRITFLNVDDPVSVEGVGLATAEVDANGGPEQKAQAISFAQKSARSSALRNAFEKIILVVVDGSKVSARVNTTKVDPFFYNPLWDEDKQVVVNETNYDETEFNDDEDV